MAHQIPQYITQKLSLEDMDVLQMIIEQSRHQLEIEVIKSQHQLEMLQTQHQLETTQHQLETTLINSKLEKSELRCEQFKETLAKVNWKLFKKSKELNIRSFMEAFERKYIVMIGTGYSSKAEKLKKWGDDKKEELAEFKMSPKTFSEIYTNLYKKLSIFAYPYFDEEQGLLLSEQDYEPEYFKLLAFLWNTFPFQANKFTVQKIDDTKIESPVAYIKTIEN